jgi:hypothetical protein
VQKDGDYWVWEIFGYLLGPELWEYVDEQGERMEDSLVLPRCKGFSARRTYFRDKGLEGKILWRFQSKFSFVKGLVDWGRDDIVRSISALTPLGPGLSVVTLSSGERYIRSIPKELNPDQATCLEVAGILGYISVSTLKVNLGWEDERSESILEELVIEGMVWIDDARQEREYWIPRGIN